MAKRANSFYPKKELNLEDKYILKEYINEGTFGYVWKAFNIQKEKTVALKIPKDQERGDNTLSEGKKLIGYSHPNIIDIVWMGRVDGVFVIEMEYFIGGTLADELTDRGFKNPKTIHEVLKIFLEVLHGVKFLHEKNICHGDIKPQNILINSDNVKITDFGTSKFIENIFVKTVDAGGTWAYMAPEIAGSHIRGLVSDIYSLGVLLYQLLTGRTPHETPIQVINNGPFPRPREINDNIPIEVQNIILKALERNPDNRFNCIDDFIKAILELSVDNKSEIMTSNKLYEKVKSKDWMKEVLQFYKSKQYNKAEIILKYQFENGNRTEDIKYHMSYVYFNQKRYYDSLDMINKMNIEKVEEIRQPGVEDNVLSLKARILVELKRYEEATEIYKALAKNNPNNINYQYKLAIMYGLIDKPDLSINKLEEINQSTPGLLYVIKKLGYAYDMKKDYSKARGYLKYAYKLDSKDSVVKNRLDVYEKYLNF